MRVDRNSLVADLREGVVEIQYSHRGNTYFFRATLAPNLTPELSEEDVARRREAGAGVITIWDHWNGGWKELLVDNIVYAQRLDVY